MKNLFIGLACFFVSVEVFAEYKLLTNNDVVELINKKYEVLEMDSKCSTLTDLSEVYMKARQTGLDQQYLINKIESGKLPPDMKLKEKQIVIKSFQIPLMSNDTDKKIISKQFALDIFFECRKYSKLDDWKFL